MQRETWVEEEEKNRKVNRGRRMGKEEMKEEE